MCCVFMHVLISILISSRGRKWKRWYYAPRLVYMGWLMNRHLVMKMAVLRGVASGGGLYWNHIIVVYVGSLHLYGVRARAIP